MKMFCLLIIALVFGCGKKEEKSDPVNHNSSNLVPQKYKYYPKITVPWYLEYWEIYPGQEAMADSLAGYYEASFKNRNSSLHHRFVPEEFLAGAGSEFDYQDQTLGSLQGMGKLNQILGRLEERCPSTTKNFLPLRVSWFRDNGELPKNINGRYGGFDNKIVYSEGNMTLVTSTTFSGYMEVKGEIIKEPRFRHTYPNQTFRDINGVAPWEIAENADFDSMFTYWSVDGTFAHELGHHYFSSWAVRNGRTTAATSFFSEMMAELFKHVCFGTTSDSPYIKKIVSEHFAEEQDELIRKCEEEPWSCRNGAPEWRPYESSEEFYRRSVGSRYAVNPYFLWSFRDLKNWKNYKEDFSPSSFWNAVEQTWLSMEGDRAGCRPAELDDRESCSWQGYQDSRTNQPDLSPLVFTKKEFLRRFCNHYDCGEIQYLIEAESHRYNALFQEW